MRRKLLWAFVGVLITLPIVGGIIGTKLVQFQTMADAGVQFVIPPESVNAAMVREEHRQPRISSVGSVMAVQGTLLRMEAEGVVRTISFEPGSVVKAGEVLVELVADVEEAQLRAAEVDAEWARISYQRAHELSKTRNISRAEFDSAATRVKQAEAQVNYIGTLKALKTLRAPFDGKLGIRGISVGQFLVKGSPVVSLQSLDPVYVDFSMPQQHVGELAEGLLVSVTSDAYPAQRFEGKITAINPEIDSQTRSVRVQATLANPDDQLRPGMFVSLDVVLAQSETALLIPATAVQHGPQGGSVFVVEEGADSAGASKPLTVRQQRVDLGERQGDFVAVTNGLKAGEKVVSTGVFKLRPGMAVTIDNRLAPEFSLAPKPANM